MDDANIDAMTMWLLKNPFNYDVLVAPNLYGDIISDLCAQMVGGLGFGCSGNIGDKLAVFEPHARLGAQVRRPVQGQPHRHHPGGQDDARLARRGRQGASAIEDAVAAVIAEGKVRTYDMGGAATTLEMAEAIAASCDDGRDQPSTRSGPATGCRWKAGRAHRQEGGLDPRLRGIRRGHRPGRLLRPPRRRCRRWPTPTSSSGGSWRARSRGPCCPGLVLNEKGLERALGLRCRAHLHGRLGLRDPQQEELGHVDQRGARADHRGGQASASAAGKQVQVSVQSAFGCGFEGRVPEERVLGIVRAYLEAGLSAREPGRHGRPRASGAGQAAVRRDHEARRGGECTCHFHDTYGLGMANIYAAMEVGVRCFETSFAGLGGCPFTKVAAGNVATEDVVHGLRRVGVRTDIDLGALIEVARDVGAFFGREMPGRVQRTGPLSY